VYSLLAGKDNNKDQSYFLCQLNQNQLSKALFPIGDLEKPEVRKIASEAGLITADKKDSQGLCFIGKVRLPEFLQQQLQPKKGKVIEMPSDLQQYQEVEEYKSEYNSAKLAKIARPFQYQPELGKTIGEHNGAHYYTIGQRKGLGIGGTPLPLFVVATDTKENLVYMGQGHDFPGLLRRALFVPQSDVHWLRGDLELAPGEKKTYDVRIRYRQPLSKADLYRQPEGLYVVFHKLMWGVTPGQFVAWYKQEELIGSGVIF
jgi:tRNA-specific 2-thiouridylase